MEAPVLTPGVSAGWDGVISGRWEAQHELRNIDNRCTEMWILPNKYGKPIWDFMGMVISMNHPILGAWQKQECLLCFTDFIAC